MSVSARADDESPPASDERGLRVARIKVASQMFLFSLGIFANDETRNTFPTKLRDREPPPGPVAAAAAARKKDDSAVPARRRPVDVRWKILLSPTIEFLRGGFARAKRQPPFHVRRRRRRWPVARRRWFVDIFIIPPDDGSMHRDDYANATLHLPLFFFLTHARETRATSMS